MNDFQTTLANFLNELSNYTGRAPYFSIDYRQQEIILLDAPSGFISQLLAARFMTSLVISKGLVVSQFKD